MRHFTTNVHRPLVGRGVDVRPAEQQQRLAHTPESRMSRPT